MSCRTTPTCLLVLLLLLSGCAAGPQATPARPPAPAEERTAAVPPIPASPAAPIAPPPQPAPPAEPPPVPAPPQQPAPDPGPEHPLSATLKLRVLAARGTMPDVLRTVQLLRKEQGDWSLVSQVNVPYLPGESLSFSTQDLPGYAGAVVIEARRDRGVRHGAVAVVDGRLVALEYHRLAAPKPEVARGVFVYLNKYVNQLWVFRDGALLATFPTANGRDPWGRQPTWQDYKQNFKTPEGLFRIRQKVLNPPYNSLSGNHPPAAGGAANNPLGTRWIGFEVLAGDGGGVWGFHGTYVPEQIGTWASEGCVRLNTRDAEQLYDLVDLGATVRIVSGR